MAISAEELRIGNWVIDHSDKLHKVTASCIVAQCQFDIANALGYRPVPLTEEKLEKCNFFRKGVEYINEYCPLHIINGNGFYMQYINVDIQHLHQLQNLYFALTGQELDCTEIL